jgi:hypothetical protein
MLNVVFAVPLRPELFDLVSAEPLALYAPQRTKCRDVTAHEPYEERKDHHPAEHRGEELRDQAVR